MNIGENLRWVGSRCPLTRALKELAMIFAGHENPLIILRSKERYIYIKTNNKLSVNLVNLLQKGGVDKVIFGGALHAVF